MIIGRRKMAEIQVKTKELFNLEYTISKDELAMTEYPWEILDKVEDIILKLGGKLDESLYDRREDGVWIAKSATVAPTAYIGAPCIIGERSEVRHGAFIRGKALVGNDCVVGNSAELKNCILFDKVQVPHYNYVGDSVLGYKSHMGAGAITSNVKSDKTCVKVKLPDGSVLETGRKKLGAMLGDGVEIGCNSVLNPGTVIGKNTNVYPLSSVRGVVPSDSIYKSGDVIVEKKK